MPNKVPGAKYEATKELKLVQVARLLRQDLAEAVRCGALPPLVVSVRCSFASMCQSLHVTIRGFELEPARGLPKGVVWRQTQVVWPERQCDEDGLGPNGMRLTVAGTAVQGAVEAFVDAYNFDRSEPESDLFRVRFYSHVGFAFDETVVQRARVDDALRAGRAGPGGPTAQPAAGDAGEEDRGASTCSGHAGAAATACTFVTAPRAVVDDGVAGVFQQFAGAFVFPN